MSLGMRTRMGIKSPVGIRPIQVRGQSVGDNSRKLTPLKAGGAGKGKGEMLTWTSTSLPTHS